MEQTSGAARKCPLWQSYGGEKGESVVLWTLRRLGAFNDTRGENTGAARRAPSRVLAGLDFDENVTAGGRSDRDLGDCGASSNMPFGPSLLFQPGVDNLCGAPGDIRDRHGLRCYPNCDSPYDNGHRPDSGPCHPGGFLPVFGHLVVRPQRVSLRVQQGLR